MTDDSDRQFRADQQAIIDTLERAGWSRTARGTSMGAASLTYDNGSAELLADQYHGELELEITLTAPDGQGVTLYAEYGENLEPLLHALVASQDGITPENFQDHVRRWLQACPDIYYQPGEDEDPLLLVPD